MWEVTDKISRRILSFWLGAEINPSLLIPPAQLSPLLSIPSVRGLGESPVFSSPHEALDIWGKGWGCWGRVKALGVEVVRCRHSGSSSWAIPNPLKGSLGP